MTTITARDLTPQDWPVFAALFGKAGACGGWWCMHFVLPRGGKLWEERKGARNRAAMKRRIERGEQRGVLAFAGDEPVGWASLGPRAGYPRMDNGRVFKTPHDAGAWSLPCLYVRAAWRRQGVSGALVRQAVAQARAAGATHLLAYPIAPGREYPAVFAFQGLPQVYARTGFRDETPPGAPRRVYVRRFAARRRRA
jgi:GNAT superfamily N-acetyltransferase